MVTPRGPRLELEFVRPCFYGTLKTGIPKLGFIGTKTGINDETTNSGINLVKCGFSYEAKRTIRSKVDFFRVLQSNVDPNSIPQMQLIAVGFT